MYKYGQYSAAEPLAVLAGHCSCLTECVTCDAAVGVLKEIKVELQTEESSCVAVGAGQPMADTYVNSHGPRLAGPPAGRRSLQTACLCSPHERIVVVFGPSGAKQYAPRDEIYNERWREVSNFL